MKRCIVTGASRGIGRATAKALGAAGHSALLTGRDEDALDRAAKEVRGAGGEAHVVAADLTEAGAPDRVVAEAVEAMGGLDVLVNNAGRGGPEPVESITDERYEDIFRLNTWAPMALTRAAVPHLEGGGQVVNIGSIVGYVASPGASVYAASKWALRGFTVSWREELYPKEIKVGYVGPGMVATEFFKGRIEPDEIDDWALDPSDVAHAVMTMVEQGPNSDIREVTIQVLDRS